MVFILRKLLLERYLRWAHFTRYFWPFYWGKRR